MLEVYFVRIGCFVYEVGLVMREVSLDTGWGARSRGLGLIWERVGDGLGAGV